MFQFVEMENWRVNRCHRLVCRHITQGTLLVIVKQSNPSKYMGQTQRWQTYNPLSWGFGQASAAPARMVASCTNKLMSSIERH